MRIGKKWVVLLVIALFAIGFVSFVFFEKGLLSSLFPQRRAPTIEYIQTYPATDVTGQERLELKGRVSDVRSDPIVYVVSAKNRMYDVVISDQTKWFCAQSTYRAPDGKTYNAEEVYIDLSRSEDSSTSSVPLSTVPYDRVHGKIVQVTADKHDGVIAARTLAIYGCPW